jgi:4-hydroxy-tetrahydrodipicolinate reductase
MKVGIFGFGKMGKAISELSQKFTEINSVRIYSCNDNDLKFFISDCDVILDFSVAEATENLTNYILENNIFPKSILIGTTALSEKTSQNISEISKKTAILKTANMSIGANIQAFISQKLAQILGNDYDIDILDIHHKEKKDAPSGTAFMIADAINNGLESSTGKKYKIITDRSSNPVRGDNEISISSIRAGKATGTHEVLFTGHYDSISITHKVDKRELLAIGALKAAIWLSKQKPNLYNMQDFIKFD